MIKHKCPTCDGSGEVELDIDEKEGSQWYKGRGDKDLWDKYSHAAIKYPSSKTWSKFFIIASFYRCRSACKDCGEYTINFWGEGGSWPIVKAADLKKRFRFIDRKSGEEVIFEDTKKGGEKI